jgi:hypothetical protein
MKPETIVRICNSIVVVLSALWLVNLVRVATRPVVDWSAALGSPMLLIIVVTLLTLSRARPAVNGSSQGAIAGKSRQYVVIGIAVTIAVAAFASGFWAGLR